MATRNFVPRANNEGGIGTSVKQWASGFFQKLAVGAITTAVTVLTPSDDANNQQPATTGWVRSQFQSILKTVLTAAGLKYNIATNGYICFGSLFGNLILQWGRSEWLSDKITFRKNLFPIIFPSTCCLCGSFPIIENNNPLKAQLYTYVYNLNNNSFIVEGKGSMPEGGGIYVIYIAIGY